MFGAWVKAGLDYALFWTLTLREVVTMLSADRDRREADIETQRAINHELAALTAYAYHNPKKMPKYKPRGEKRTPASDELANAKVFGFFVGLAQSSKKKKD
jgi:hypothetical protein